MPVRGELVAVGSHGGETAGQCIKGVRTMLPATVLGYWRGAPAEVVIVSNSTGATQVAPISLH